MLHILVYLLYSTPQYIVIGDLLVLGNITISGKAPNGMHLT